VSCLRRFTRVRCKRSVALVGVCAVPEDRECWDRDDATTWGPGEVSFVVGAGATAADLGGEMAFTSAVAAAAAVVSSDLDESVAPGNKALGSTAVDSDMASDVVAPAPESPASDPAIEVATTAGFETADDFCGGLVVRGGPRWGSRVFVAAGWNDLAGPVFAVIVMLCLTSIPDREDTDAVSWISWRCDEPDLHELGRRRCNP